MITSNGFVGMIGNEWIMAILPLRPLLEHFSNFHSVKELIHESFYFHEDCGGGSSWSFYSHEVCEGHHGSFYSLEDCVGGSWTQWNFKFPFKQLFYVFRSRYLVLLWHLLYIYL